MLNVGILALCVDRCAPKGETMKCKTLMAFLMAMFFLAAAGYAAEDQTSLGTQAGESARELKDKADQNYAVASAKVTEATKKVEAETQDALKTLQQQMDSLSKQLQVSTQQLSQQLQKQWEDFQKSFNQPKQ